MAARTATGLYLAPQCAFSSYVGFGGRCKGMPLASTCVQRKPARTCVPARSARLVRAQGHGQGGGHRSAQPAHARHRLPAAAEHLCSRGQGPSRPPADCWLAAASALLSGVASACPQAEQPASSTQQRAVLNSCPVRLLSWLCRACRWVPRRQSCPGGRPSGSASWPVRGSLLPPHLIPRHRRLAGAADAGVSPAPFACERRLVVAQ